MRVGLYGRVSTEEQAIVGFSISAQKEKLRAYCHAQDWLIVEEYFDEGVSGKHTDRPELNRLLTDVRSQKLDVVLVYRLDRLTRSVLDLYQLLQEFERHQVSFASATEVYDTTSAMGRLFITLVAALAQWERENLAERVKLGMEQMAREEKRPGGRSPYGYRCHSSGHLEVDRREAGIIRDIFAMYLSGHGFARIAAMLNERGVPARKGGNWTESTLQRIVRNPVYYGALRWNYASKLSGRQAPENWILIENVYEPIISRETFLSAQTILDQRSKRHPRQLASDFLFSGVLFCARCESPMTGKTGRIRRGEKTYQYRFYRCTGKRTSNCPAPIIREDRLEAAFVETVLRPMRVPVVTVQRLVSSARRSLQQKVERLGREQDAIAARRLRWQLSYLDGLIEKEEWIEGRKRDQILVEKLHSEQKMLQATLSVPEEALLGFLCNWPLAWSMASPAERKRMASLLVKRIEAASDKRVVTIKRVIFQ